MDGRAPKKSEENPEEELRKLITDPVEQLLLNKSDEFWSEASLEECTVSSTE